MAAELAEDMAFGSSRLNLNSTDSHKDQGCS